MKFLFSVIENAFSYWNRFGDQMPAVMERHQSLMDSEIQRFEGMLVKYTSDQLFAVFEDDQQAIHCALNIQQKIASITWPVPENIRVGIGIHGGTAEEQVLPAPGEHSWQKKEYFGPAVNRAAHLAKAARGGQILVTPQALEGQVLPPDASLLDLGYYLFKDKGQPQQVYQLVHPNLKPSQFPEINATPFTETNLPVYDFPLFGRQQEIQLLEQWIKDPSRRLINISGPAGTGKTRLSVHLATKLKVLFSDGIYFVPMTGDKARPLLQDAILTATQLHYLNKPAPISHLIQFFRNKNCLLILDDIKPISEDQSFTQQLLSNTRGLKILATSQTHFDIFEESVFLLPGLPVPSSENDPSLHFFVASARQIKPDFSPTPADIQNIQQIILQVEGNPLAIQMTASKVAELSCAQIAQQLAEVTNSSTASEEKLSSEWQLSLYAMFEYSWSKLSPLDKSYVAQLSQFDPDFSKHAATEIIGVSPTIIRNLVKRSIVQVNQYGRFHVYGLLRRFAQQKKPPYEEFVAQFKSKFQEYYCHFCQEHTRKLFGTQHQSTLEDIGQEVKNLQLAWRWAIEAQNLVALGQLFLPLFEYFDSHGLFHKGLRLFAQGVQTCKNTPASTENKVLSARLMLRQAHFCFRDNQSKQAQAIISQAVNILKATPSPEDAAYAQLLLSNIADAQADCILSISHAQQAFQLAQQANHQRSKALALLALGRGYYRTKCFQNAAKTIGKCLSIFNQLGDQSGQAQASTYLGTLAMCFQKDLPLAQYYFEKSLAINQATRNHWAEAQTINNLSEVYQQKGELNKAMSLLNQSLAIFHRYEDRISQALVLNNLGFIASHYFHQYPQAKSYYLQSIECYSSDNLTGTGFSYKDWAIAAIRAENFEEARQVLRQALQTCIQIFQQDQFFASPLAYHILLAAGLWHISLKHWEAAQVLLKFFLMNPQSIAEFQSDPIAQERFQTLKISVEKATLSRQKPGSLSPLDISLPQLIQNELNLLSTPKHE